MLEGGIFKKGQFSFALKDADGKVLQTVTNDAKGNVSFNVDYNKAGTYTYSISEVVPRAPRTTSRTTSPTTQSGTMLRLT